MPRPRLRRPRLRPLHVVARVVESRPVDAVLTRAARALQPREDRGPFPAPPPLGKAADVDDAAPDALELMAELSAAPAEPDEAAPSVRSYFDAYQQRRVSPVEVADAFLAAVRESEQGEVPMRFFISVRDDDVRAQAAASARRYDERRPLSILDGVPVAIKDEIDQGGHPTTLGTGMPGLDVARSDCVAVARLRALGALLVGKANMHELGAGPTGLNAVHGTCRNPWDPARFPGGSSSGSAALVAAGLVPLAVGCDGGGSIRIPASLSGIVGLKPTFGRVPKRGETLPIAASVTHIGPIGRTVHDVALGYAALAGRDDLDRETLGQPRVSLVGWDAADLRGVTLGVVEPWWKHAEPDVVRACERSLGALIARGARVRDVQLDGLDGVLTSLVFSIAVELKRNAWIDDVESRRRLAVDTRVGLAFARHLGPRVYQRAQRQRARIAAGVARVLDEVDLLVSPTTQTTAPLIPGTKATGDLRTTVSLLKATALANVTGHPAISFPAGYDRRGLPIGMQVLARPWEEALLLRVARLAEESQRDALRERTPVRSWRPLPAR